MLEQYYISFLHLEKVFKLIFDNSEYYLVVVLIDTFARLNRMPELKFDMIFNKPN
jgi:hypothetical protein